MGYVYKLIPAQNTLRLACENQGCLDLTISNVDAEKANVEILMNHLHGLIVDHK
jgi:hypothetical protein